MGVCCGETPMSAFGVWQTTSPQGALNDHGGSASLHTNELRSERCSERLRALVCWTSACACSKPNGQPKNNASVLGGHWCAQPLGGHDSPRHIDARLTCATDMMNYTSFKMSSPVSALLRPHSQ